MITVDEVKTALRMTAGPTALDWEVHDTIEAARLDLATAGVMIGEGDALTDMAIKLYAKRQFDFCGQGEKYGAAYEDLKKVLSLCGDYKEEGT